MAPAPLDRQLGVQACGGDPALHRQVVGILAGELGERVAALRRALIAHDLANAGRLAHKHKGASLAVGALALAERFAAIDAAARGGDGLRAAAEADRLAADAEAFVAAARAATG